MHMLSKLSAAAALAGTASAWLPEGKIRGVNLGTLFIYEPWIDNGEWSSMGCDGQKSEFDCVSSLGQDAADAAFQKHWQSWLTTGDLDEIKSYGLNTIRIPVGYWFKEDLVDSSEHFPKGGLDALTSFVGAASDRGLYVIMDLHGGPGAQEANQPFTGQNAPEAGFYNDYNYGRAVEWLRWMTELVHTKDEFRGVGMIELINEPLHGGDSVETMRSKYYPDALNAIREVESNLGVSDDKAVHVQMMSSLWGSGNPNEFLPDARGPTSYDDHRYLKWDTSVTVDKDAYIKESCGDDRTADGEDHIIVGEWSISVPDDVEGSADWSPSGNADFYKKWFAAQVQTYERSAGGWVFWTWKAALNDPRWSYKDAVDAGIIDKDIQAVLDSQVC